MAIPSSDLSIFIHPVITKSKGFLTVNQDGVCMRYSYCILAEWLIQNFEQKLRSKNLQEIKNLNTGGIIAYLVHLIYLVSLLGLGELGSRQHQYPASLVGGSLYRPIIIILCDETTVKSRYPKITTICRCKYLEQYYMCYRSLPPVDIMALLSTFL